VSQIRAEAVERALEEDRPPVAAPDATLDQRPQLQALPLLSLQRSAGNRAVADLVRRRAEALQGGHSTSRPIVQRRTLQVPEAHPRPLGDEVADDMRTELTIVLLGLSRAEVVGAAGTVSPGMAARLEHARNFYDRGATADEARFVFHARLAAADLDRLVGIMLGHLGHLDAVQWALNRAGIAGLETCLEHVRGLGYDTALTEAYYDAGVLPARSIADVLHVISLGAPRDNPTLVGVIARFLADGAEDDDARFALGTGLTDGQLDRLLAVIRDHPGQRAAVQWAFNRAGIAALETCIGNVRGLGYDTVLTGAYYDAGVLPARSIADVLHAVDLGAERSNPARVGHVLDFLAAGASEAEARFALGVAASDADLVQLQGVMAGHLGQLAAVDWAVKRAGTDWALAARDLDDAKRFGYDTDIAEWARRTGEVEADVVRQERGDRIDEDLKQRMTVLDAALTTAEKEHESLVKTWTKKKWRYHAATPPVGDSPGTAAYGVAPRNQNVGQKHVDARTAAATKVSDAKTAIERAEADAQCLRQQADAEKPQTAQSVVDLIAAYVNAGVAPADAQSLHAQLGQADFRALYDVFGAGTGTLINALGVPLTVTYLKARSPGALAPLVAHLTAAGLASLHPTIRVDEALRIWDVFGVQLAPLIAFMPPPALRSMVWDDGAPLAYLFKHAGGAATTLLRDIGRMKFVMLVRDLTHADLAEFLAHAVPAARLAEIAAPTCVKQFAAGCAADRASLITLCNDAAFTTAQIITLLELCAVGSVTLSRCVAAAALARDPTALVTILALQQRAGLSNVVVDQMLTTHAGLQAPARGIEHDVYERLARQAQNEGHLDGPGLQLLLSPENTHYRSMIKWVEDRKTSYDTGSGYSEIYNVHIPDPATGLVPRVYWQIHLHRKGGQTESGSIKKYSQRFAVGAGVYRGILPMELEDMVRATRT
jgi:hypothetical protein